MCRLVATITPARNGDAVDVAVAGREPLPTVSRAARLRVEQSNARLIMPASSRRSGSSCCSCDRVGVGSRSTALPVSSAAGWARWLQSASGKRLAQAIRLCVLLEARRARCSASISRCVFAAPYELISQTPMPPCAPERPPPGSPPGLLRPADAQHNLGRAIRQALSLEASRPLLARLPVLPFSPANNPPPAPLVPGALCADLASPVAAPEPSLDGLTA
ncbi:hypothetical protein BU26DRAFT_143381 [Trematosphaeria pertusa]|uniref:Uncharacterized protein n=1 Tax=Trematosphaeria pertusa TaxID=390896 RepID=A0A6A6IVT4_9PLEO|nr:uncharacterized protein BU26DRAFT_143381 [Trematosphaeria pertusa]KAF2254675.1 hypothetical protein BU26DRAFT_143381 [Trematosphaeria pertusa]